MAGEEILNILNQLVKDERVEAVLRALGPEIELFLVGGCVRDAFYGHKITDIDLATSAVPTTIIEHLTRSGIKTIPTGLRHQTVTAVPVAGSPAIELTTFRGASMSPEGGLNISDNINTDLANRDFSINALAFDVRKRILVDPNNGESDIERKIIRAVGNSRSRFSEDPLRVLRMIRFACREGFSIEPDTQAASKLFVSDLSKVAVERIRDEFSKILVSDQPVRGLELLHELGVLKIFLPEVERYVGFEQNSFHKADLWVHTLEVVRKTPPELALRLSALLHDVGKPDTLSVDEKTGERHFYKHESVGARITKEILVRLRYPNHLLEDVCCLVRTHMRPLSAGPSGIRRLLRDTGELFETWRILKRADASACKLDQATLDEDLQAFDQAVAIVQREPAVHPLKNLALNGNDLLAAGVPAGPTIGIVLHELHERVLDEPALNEKPELIALIPQILQKLSEQ